MIGDESAEFFLLHDDAARRIAARKAWVNPLVECASEAQALRDFNVSHPLYGGRPVKLLVPEKTLRHVNSDIACGLASDDYPAGSFFELREGLYMATPEFVFVRAATRLPFGSLVALAVNLSARYYLQIPDGLIAARSSFLTTPKQMQAYLDSATGQRGCKKATRALRYATGNSASPEETRSWVLFSLPAYYGGFGLPFTHMNFDVQAGRLANLTGQDNFSLDLVALNLKIAFEYDGKEFHEDAGKDKRRRNDLKVLGWDVYPIDASVLYSPEESIRTARQLARLMGKRLRLDKEWERKYIELRKSIGLPV